MKLTIIPLVNPTEQQYLDLYKIWTDQTQAQLNDALHSGQHFYAARFNNRLLAAAKVKINTHHGVISEFHVREVTRRRGVGLYLLHEICHQEPEVSHWYFNFSELAQQGTSVMEAFLAECQFNPTEKPFVWEMKVTK